jgi:hypothetical protein
MQTKMRLQLARSPLAVAIFGAAWAACGGGCNIDPRSLTVHDGGPGNPPPLVIATFEHGTAQPDDPRFLPFQYYAYNETADSAVTSPLAVPGHNSNAALGLNWIVFDAPNGHPDYPGVGVRTLVNGSIDLSGYSRIVFGLKYSPTPAGPLLGAAGCFPVPALTVSIGCSEHNTSFRKNVPMTSDWTTVTAAFADFAEPSYLPATGTAFEDCLKVVDGIDFSAQVDLADGQCASGGLLLDDISVRPPLETDGGADTGSPSTGIALVPDADGHFDGSNAAGVVGSWWAAGDYYGEDSTAGAGTCPMAGFASSVCSALTTPTPGMPFRPDPNGKGMCTSGITAQVEPGSDGQLAWTSIWGNIIGFDLVDTGANRLTSVVPPYDAVARGITGFAFDIDAVPPGGHLRVGFGTVGKERDPAYWGGAIEDQSPVLAPGHYEMRWAEIGGPKYMGPSAPPFDPRALKWIQFHVPSIESAPIPYRFCISNAMLLTN